MFSRIELKHMLEKAFLPTLCNCSFSDDGVMDLELVNPTSHAKEMDVPGVLVSEIHNGRALAELVREVKRNALALKGGFENDARQAG